MSSADRTVAVQPVADAVTVRRRPRDRKRHILAAAADLFWRSGYHRVAMADIAGAVDIAPSALYRHYRNKQDLLVAVLEEALADVDTASPQDIDGLVDQLAHRGLERREFAALWDREKRHLPAGDRDRISERLQAVEQRAVTAVAAHRPGEAASVVELRAHAVLAVLDSPSYHRADVRSDRFRTLLHHAARVIVDADVAPAGAVPAVGGARGRDPQQPASRREALLAVAVHLFAQHGYPDVSLSDIGAAAGMAGPSVYSHFATKHDLLVAGLNRGNEALWLALHHALAAADGPLDALHRTLDSYVTFAAANPGIMSAMLTEAVHLPGQQQEQYRRAQHEYVAEWAALLRRARPELDVGEARALVNAALALPNTLLRDRRIRDGAALVPGIMRLGRAVLGASAS